MPVNILRIAETLKKKTNNKTKEDVFKFAAKITCRETLLKIIDSLEEI